MATVLERVRKLAAAQLGITADEIRSDAIFTTDLGADSLDMVEMMIALENEFTIHGKKIAIPDEESEKMLSVQDIVNYIRSIGITDVEAPKTSDKSELQRSGTGKPAFSRLPFRRSDPPRQDKNNQSPNQQQNRTRPGRSNSNPHNYRPQNQNNQQNHSSEKQ